MKYLLLLAILGCTETTAVPLAIRLRCANVGDERGYSETDSAGHIVAELKFCDPPYSFGLILRALKASSEGPSIDIP